MADQLADILNSVSTDPQGAVAPSAPTWAAKALQLLTQGQRTAGNIGISLADAVSGGPLRRDTMRAIQGGDASFPEMRTYAGQAARIPTDIVGGALMLPNLPNAVTELATDRDQSSWRIDPLMDAFENVHQKGQDVGQAIAGKPLNDSLLEGSPTDLGASWTRLIAGAAIPIPGSWQAKMTNGLQKVSGGNAAAQMAAKTATTTMEMLTPLTLNPKAVAPNIVASAAIAPALEIAVANHENAKEQIAAGSEQAKGALDVAAQGAQEVRNAKAIQASILPVTTGDDTTDAVIGASLLGAAVFSQMKFNIAGRVLNGTKKAVTSYDPNNVLEKTEMPWSTLIEQQYIKRAASSEEAFKQVLKSQNAPDVEARVTAIKESNSMRTGAAVDTRLKSFYNDGTLPDSRHSAQPLNDLYVRYGQLPEQDKGLLDYALISQREIDTRRINKVAFDLYDTDTRDLLNYVNTAKANPAVKQLFDDYLATTRVLGNYMEEQRRFTPGEIKQFRNKNPNYVATNITDPSGNWLSQRTPGQFKGLKTFEEMGSPMRLLPQYVDEVVRSTEGKKMQRDFFNEFMHAKGRNDPYAQKLIGRTLTDAPPKESKDLFVHWRNGRGESRWTEVTDVAVRNSVRGATNPSALQIHKGFGKATRWYESGAVGTAAAVTGNIFAPKSYLYARTFGSVFRPEGVATSPLDKLVQEITQRTIGKKIGVPEPFTAMPMDIFNMARGVQAVFIQRGAVALRNSVIKGGPLAKMYDGVRPYVPMGPQTAQAAADALATMYKKTGAAMLQRDGLLGPGTFASVDPALSYRQAESVLRAKGVWGWMGETGTFIGDVLHAITTAPAITTKQLNKNLPKSQVNNAIRNMSGDPGAAGAYRNADTLAASVNTIPWMNIFLQSGFRMVSGGKKNIAGAAAGIMGTAVMPEVMLSLWNATAGPEYVDYAYTQRPAELQASSFYIAIPGADPAEGVEIPVDPWLRPFKTVGQVLATSYLGLLDGSFFSPDNEMIQQAGRDMVLHQHKETFKGALSQTLSPPVPGFVQGAAGLADLDMRSWWDIRKRGEKLNAGFSDAQGPKGAMFLEHYGFGHLQDLLKGLGAQAGATVYTMLDDTLTRRFGENYGRNEENQSWSESIKQGVAANAKMNLKKSGEMLGTASLFDHARAISPSMESAGVLVQEKLNGLRSISEGFKTGTQSGNATDMTGKKERGWQELLGTGPIGPRDEVMAIVAQRASEVYQELSTAYSGARKDLYAQRQSVSTSSRYSPQNKRYIMNEIADEIIQMDRKMLVDIERAEAVISNQLGVPVKFDKVKMNKGQEQFK